MSKTTTNETLPRYNYPAGTLINIDGAPHQPPARNIPGRLMMMDANTGQMFVIPDGKGGTVLPTEDDFDRLVIEGRIEVEIPANIIPARALAGVAEWDMSDLEAIDPGIRKVIAQVELLDENGVKNGVKAIGRGLKKLWTPELQNEFGDHDKPITIKRWRMERGKPGDRPPRLMARLNGNVARRPQDQNAALEIRIKHALECVQNKTCMKTSHGAAMTELIAVNEGRSATYAKPTEPYPLFSYDTFRRQCIALEGSDTVEAKDGKAMVDSAMRGAGPPLKASRVLEKVIIDHTRLDAFLLVDEEHDIVGGRPWLTLAIDVHSRAILAFVITYRAPSYWTVIECIRRMNLPKRPPPKDAKRYPILKRICGHATEIYLDNAMEFRCKSFEDAAKCGSFSVHFGPIRSPRYRAIVERAFGTFQRKMLENLPGHSMTIEYNRRAKHDGEDLACVLTDEIEALGNKACAEYHTEPHEGLNDLQPALVFQKSANKHGIDVMRDLRRFRLETFEVKLNVQVRKSGVRIFDGLRYEGTAECKRLIDNNLKFEPRRQKRVDATVHTKVKYDPDDISVIHVLDKETNSYVTLKCADETYSDGMPLWFHKELVDLAKRDATAPPKETARKRTKRSVPADDDTVIDQFDDGDKKVWRRLSGDPDETAPAGFNTEAERMAARAERIAAIKNITPGAEARKRQTLAILYDVPRIRAITGNLVSLDTDFSKVVTTDDFITHDVSSLTALDAEILSDRPALPTTRKPRTGHQDHRTAGKPRKASPTPEAQGEERIVSNPRRRARK
ncbi:MAG: transposase family protein [Pontixanthobacter sp.]